MFLPFLYFAYGSNLLASRIHTSIPQAVRSDVAKLKDYRLDFDLYSPHWRGCPANIAPHKGKEVWGVLWKISAEDLVKLDQQEKVYEDFYSRSEVEVELSDGKRKKCFVYAHKEASKYYPLTELPEERRPSQIYLKQIIEGAKESNLPMDYQNMLRKVPDNGEYFKPDYNAINL